MTFPRKSFHRFRFTRFTRSLTATCAVLLPAAAVSATPVAVATPSQGGFYGSVEGSLSRAAATGSGKSAVGSLPNHDPDGFYSSLPLQVKGRPGEILKTARSNFALGIPFVDWTNSEAQRVAYVSTNSRGETVPVTGTVLVPRAPYTGGGERPLLVVAPGTQGSGDACAPGKLLPLGLEYEAAPVAAALSRGWAVALTDLNGLGTPAQHTYMNRVDQGNATLDMARAAKNMQRVPKSAPVALWGYSQGGGSSAAALELASTYAPEINLKAGYAGGVPADLAMTSTAIDNGPLAAALGYTLNGFLISNPEIRDAVESRMNAKGKEYVRKTASECLPESLARHAYTDTRTLTKSGESLTELLRQEPFKKLVDAQRIGNRPPQVPVYVGHGTNDDTIPVEQSRRMARQWAEGGTKVNYVEHNIPRTVPLGDHMLPMLTHLLPALDWLDNVLHGRPVPFNKA